MRKTQLQSRCDYLEECIQSNLQEICEDKQVLLTRFRKLKDAIFASEILTAGFAIGYLFAPKSSTKKSKSSFPFKIRRKAAKILAAVPPLLKI